MRLPLVLSNTVHTTRHAIFGVAFFICYPLIEALLHKSADGQTSPYPGQTYPATFVTGMPSAV